MHRKSSRSAFTLIELLVVIAIIAILAIVVVLTLNPAQMLAQGRDSNRVSDISTLNSALNLYNTDQSGSSGFSLGNASSVYISLPDPTISGNTTSTCSYWNLPTLPTGYGYQCSSPQDYRNINGTGWIPVNLSNISAGAPLSNLPVDPTNSSSTGLYYTYYANGNQYEVTSLFESQKYKAQYGQTPMDPYYPEVDTKGSNLSISPLFNPSGLVGWWPLDEGTGSSSIDQSGNWNNGTWYGAASGTSGYYSQGKVGPWAGYFNGSSTYMNISGISYSLNSYTRSFWLNPPSGTYTGTLITDTGWSNRTFDAASGATVTLNFSNIHSVSLPAGSWTFVVEAANGATDSIYINGALSTSTAYSSSTVATGLYVGYACCTNYQIVPATIDDVRIYNRALSAAEIQALYNAEK